MAGLDAGTAFVTILPKVGAEFSSSLSRSLTGPIAAEGAKISKALSSSLTLGKAAAIGAFAAIGAAAIKGMASAVHATEAFGEQVLALKRQLGLSAPDASRLAVVLEHFGLDARTAAVGFGIFEKGLVNGSAGVKRYGLSLYDANGQQKPFLVSLGEAADKFVSLPPGAQRAALAVNLFGKSGRALIPILSEGSKGLSELMAEADRYGLVLTGSNLEAIHKFALAQNDLTLATQGFKVQIGVALIPALTAVVRVVTEAVVLFGQIPGPLRAAALVAAALGASLVALGLVVGVVTRALGNLGITLGANAAAQGADAAATEANTVAHAGLAATLAGGVIRSLGYVGVALAAAAANHFVNAEAAKQDAQGHGILAGVLKVLGFGLPQTIAWLSKMQAGHDAAGASAASFGLTEERVATMTAQLTGQVKLSTDAYYANATAALAARDAQLALSGGLIGIIGAARSLHSANATVAADQKAVNEALAKGGKASQGYRDAVAKLRDDQWSAVNANVSLKQAVDSYAQTLMGPVKAAQDAVTSATDASYAALAKYGKGSTQAQQADAALAQAKANLADAERGLAPAQQKAIAQLNGMLRAAGFTKAEIAALDAKVIGYADDVAGVPKAASTKFSTPGLAEANAAVQHLANGVTALTRGPHEIVFVVKTIGNIPHMPPVHGAGSVFRAAAGTLFMGPGRVGPFIAGEAAYPTPLGVGAELVSNAGVLPLDDATIAKLGAAIAAAGGSARPGRSGPLVISVQVDRREIARAVTAQELWER